MKIQTIFVILLILIATLSIAMLDIVEVIDLGGWLESVSRCVCAT